MHSTMSSLIVMEVRQTTTINQRSRYIYYEILTFVQNQVSALRRDLIDSKPLMVLCKNFHDQV